MLSSKQKTSVQNLFNSLNKNEEFEIMFNNYRRDNKLSIVNFMKVLKYFRWKSDNENLKLKKEILLDIIYNYENNNAYRVSIEGNDEINSFLNLVHNRKNNIIFTILMTQYINNNNVTVIHKEKNKKNIVDLDNYDIRFRKSKEESIDNKTINNLANLPLSQSEKIIFRYKQRISLILSDKDNCKLDLTIVKTSDNPNTLISANKAFELEIDYSPEKLNSKVLKLLLTEMENIKKVLEESDEIIDNDSKLKVVDSYKKIVYGSSNNDYKNLYSMHPISAEVQHIIDKVPNRYSVTDKADGDKYSLFVLDGSVYLLSNNLEVKKLDKNVKGLNNTILEGELIHITSQRKYLYMVFDCLYYDGKDVRNMKDLKKRLEYVNLACQKLGTKVYENKSYSGTFNLDLMRKYYENEVFNFYSHINKEMSNLKFNDILYHPKYFMFPSGGNSSEAFIFSDIIWTSCTENDKINCPYDLDGIIYTGMEQRYTRDKREQKLPIYKYKPPDKNSIDVYVTYERNSETGKYLEVFDNSLPDKIENQNFRILNLNVGEFVGNKEIPVPFMKEEENNQGFFPIERGEVRDIEGNLIQDKTVIEIIYVNDPMIPHQYRWNILRTRWDKTESIRRDGRKYGNYKDVAIKTWKSMKEAVSIEEIRNLANPDTFISQKKTLASRIDTSIIVSDRKQDVYYQKISNLCKEMRQFHNFIKSIMIYTYCSPEKIEPGGKVLKKRILDIGCGKGGDIMKIYHARVKEYVGIDVDYEGINSSVDGAISRYNNLKKKFPDFTDAIFLQADGSLPLNINSQSKKFPNLTQENKDNIKKYFKNEKSFDVINSQMAIHYLFDTQASIDYLIENIKNNLKVGGYVLLTLFDTNKIEKILNEKNVYTSYYTDDDGNRKKLFEIKKTNQNKDLCSKNKNIPTCLPIDVYMGWFSEEGRYITEYLPTNELMIDTMRKAGCQLVDTDLFKNIYYMNKYYFENVVDYEENEKNKQYYDKVKAFYDDLKGPSKDSKDWSFLFRFYIFKKIE